MRRELVRRAAGLMLLAGAAGCSAPGSSQPPAAAVQPTAQPPGSPDADAPKFVTYQDYREAALQMSIPADLPAAAAFRQSLRRSCRTTPSGPAELRPGQLAPAEAAAEPTGTLQPRAVETSLRVGLGCPRRMSDWLVVRQIGDDTPSSPADAGPPGAPDESRP
jgi:hypothetical protein